MATTKGLAVNTMQAVATKTEGKDITTLKGLLSSPAIKRRFNELIGEKAPGFMSSLLSVVNNNKLLAGVDPTTVISAGAMAATLDLPINQNLGFAYIIPYRNNKTGRIEAQFQLGYKGYIQLAQRAGQYKTINACEVYEGEITKVNRFTGEFEFGEKVSETIVGYIAYFKLINGFEKYLYMAADEMERHAQKYSKSYKKTGKWGLDGDFHTMAIKTVIKRLLSKYGILSISMQSAVLNDGGVIKETDTGELEADFDGNTIDVDGVGGVDPETGEILSEEEKAEIAAEEEKSSDPALTEFDQTEWPGRKNGESALDYNRRLRSRIK